MQGHTACQLKPTLFWPDKPKFPAVTAVFPGRGGFVIFIFFPGGNPVKYTDPDGRLSENADGVAFDKPNDKLWKGAEAAGWDNYREALDNALFIRDGTVVNVTSWYDEKGTWIGGDNTLVGITMSRKEPNFNVPTGTITSSFGRRPNPTGSGNENHTGIDIRMPTGTSVNSAALGVVSAIGNDGGQGYGKWVDVRHGNGFTTRYGHLSRIWYNPGKVLPTGTELGLSGNTGRSTGPHLHFEIRQNGVPINPNR
jgi:murein DD-endopeptidase MepM/ murein hydrolase activator NlpD